MNIKLKSKTILKKLFRTKDNESSINTTNVNDVSDLHLTEKDNVPHETSTNNNLTSKPEINTLLSNWFKDETIWIFYMKLNNKPYIISFNNPEIKDKFLVPLFTHHSDAKFFLEENLKDIKIDLDIKEINMNKFKDILTDIFDNSPADGFITFTSSNNWETLLFNK